jgi:hypothetical protein
VLTNTKTESLLVAGALLVTALFTSAARADELAPGLCGGSWGEVGVNDLGGAQAECNDNGSFGEVSCTISGNQSVCSYKVSETNGSAQTEAQFECCTNLSQTNCTGWSISPQQWTPVNAGWINVRPCPGDHPYANVQCRVATSCQ